MSKRDPKVRLMHMRDYARKALDMVQGQSRNYLNTDEKLCLALTHLVELIGEAASQVPQEIQSQYPQIPWPKVIGTRHRLIHGYDAVDYDLLWDTITGSQPGLVDTLSSILGEK